MKKFLIWLAVIIIAASAAAGWYAYEHGVRSWDEAKYFARHEWQRITEKTKSQFNQEEEQQASTQQQPVQPVITEPTQKAKSDTVKKPKAEVIAAPEETTDRFSIFSAAEDEEYDTLLIGHWQCVDHPTWHKVYTDEYSGNGYYWGKEWDEAEDVNEDDLVDYGNGWFEWKMDKNDVLELATTDMTESRVPFIYTIKKLSDKDLIYVEQRSTAKQVFRRQQ